MAGHFSPVSHLYNTSLVYWITNYGNNNIVNAVRPTSKHAQKAGHLSPFGGLCRLGFSTRDNSSVVRETLNYERSKLYRKLKN